MSNAAKIGTSVHNSRTLTQPHPKRTPHGCVLLRKSSGGAEVREFEFGQHFPLVPELGWPFAGRAVGRHPP